jgi:Domain of unknown function (DUF4328)
VAGGSRFPFRFVPSGRLGRSLIIALGSNAAMAWIVLVGVYTFFERVWRGLGGRFAGQSLEGHWEQLEVARRLQGLAWVVTAVLFLIWMRRVYGNAVATGYVRIRLSPRWVVGTFFVPGVNVLWPFLVIREIWGASGPEADSAIQPRSTPAWLAWWWGLFVLATVLDPGLWRLVEDTSTRFSLGLPSLFLVLAQLLEIAAAILGIVVVRRINQRQEESWASAEAA